MTSSNESPDVTGAPRQPAQPVPLMQRVTTRYDAQEDRFVMWGTVRYGAQQPEVVRGVWLTQRLLRGLLARWVQWLEVHGTAELAWVPAEAGAGGTAHASPERAPARQWLQAMEQSAAREQLRSAEPAQPVVAPGAPDSAAWLVQAVTLRTQPAQPGRDAVLQMIFRTHDDVAVVALELKTPQFRQWLDIVYRQWRTAQWPMSDWPRWMEDAPADALATSPGPRALH